MEHYLEHLKRNMEIMQEISRERAKQDEQWGGQEHDDTHSPGDWFRFISYQVHRGSSGDSVGDMHKRRRRLVKIAALAIAALESDLRKMGE
jgi:hypothetical protein